MTSSLRSKGQLAGSRGLIFKPNSAAARSKLSRLKLRFLSGVEFADGKHEVG
jgi:hypothetical protein